MPDTIVVRPLITKTVVVTVLKSGPQGAAADIPAAVTEQIGTFKEDVTQTISGFSEAIEAFEQRMQDAEEVNANEVIVESLPTLGIDGQSAFNALALTKAAIDAFLSKAWVANRFHNPSYNGFPTTTLTISSGNVYFQHIVIPKVMTLKGLLAEVTTPAAGYTITLGLYNVDSQLKPTTLIHSSIAHSAGTTGVKYNTAADIVLQPGVYALAIVPSTNIQVRAIDFRNVTNFIGFDPTLSTTLLNKSNMVFTLFTNGLLPADLTGSNFSFGNENSNVPVVMISLLP